MNCDCCGKEFRALREGARFGQRAWMCAACSWEHYIHPDENDNAVHAKFDIERSLRSFFVTPPPDSGGGGG